MPCVSVYIYTRAKVSVTAGQRNGSLELAKEESRVKRMYGKEKMKKTQSENKLLHIEE